MSKKLEDHTFPPTDEGRLDADDLLSVIQNALSEKGLEYHMWEVERVFPEQGCGHDGYAAANGICIDCSYRSDGHYIVRRASTRLNEGAKEKGVAQAAYEKWLSEQE